MEWDEDKHAALYTKIKSLSKVEASELVLQEVKKMLLQSKDGDHDSIKAAESLMIYWQLNLSNTKDKSFAGTLLYQIYQRLNQPEKARKFLDL